MVKVRFYKKYDLEKIVKKSGYSSLWKFAKTNGFDHVFLRRASKGEVNMSENYWNKITKALDK